MNKTSTVRVISIGLAFIGASLIPIFVDTNTSGEISYYFLWSFMTIGLALMWGLGGILSFGQTAFFGLAGYAYSILTINWGGSPLATWSGLVLSMLAAACFAALLGYMIFFGKITGIFVGIITLSITLVFETFMAQTAGPQWTIGTARLNGFNGMSGMPQLSIPFPGSSEIILDGAKFYYVVLILLALATWFAVKFSSSMYGLRLKAIRDNPKRAEMLGIDIRLHQLVIFVIGGTLAALSGSLYTIWGGYITPSSMSMSAAAMPVIWVAIGGRRSIYGVVAATIVTVWFSQWLAIYGTEYALIVLGLVLLFVTLIAPQGFMPWLAEKLSVIMHMSRSKKSGEKS